MKKYSGYLMVSDLDGTLINSHQSISRQNIDAIEAFIREGGLFAAATGRTEQNVLPYIKHIRVNCPCILYNGAMLYDIDSNTSVKAIFLNKEQLLEPLKEILTKYEKLCMQIFAPGKMFIVSGRDNMDPLVEEEGQPYEMACIDDIANENWVKVLFADTGEVLREVQQFLTNRMSAGSIHSAFSSPTYLELFAGGVSKGSMLEKLMKITGVKRERVIAIGDYCNDIEMIKTAGLGVATANAHELLREAADIITVSNDEHAIYNLISKILPVYANTRGENRAIHLAAEKCACVKITV
ncbi:MAG TPA: HAD family hydrolase [Clostridia bacterium]|nr:HAD family hydrolase [Clostridia bacterium]